MKSTLILALAATLLAAAPAYAVPSLKGDITVNADIVTVGDMFDNAGALSETAIFRAPAPGTTGIVPIGDVQHAAQLAGVGDFENVGYTRIRVVRMSTIVDASMLGELISAELARRNILGGTTTAETHFDLAAVSLNAEQVADPATLADLRYAPETGAFTARFMVAGIDQPVDLTGRVTLMTMAPRLLETHAAGTILGAADFEMVPVPASTANAGSYADLDQLVGKQVLRQSRAGMMLKPTDVGPPTVVTRNAEVTVLFRAGVMTLTVRGLALNTAAAGEPVDVLNTLTKKILHGIARSDGSVDIPAAMTTASL